MDLTISQASRRPRLAILAALTILALSNCRLHSLSAEDKAPLADRQGMISGKIVDASKSPVAGAKVTLYRWQSPTRRWGHFRVVGEPVTTDSSGAYRFAGLRDDYLMVSVEGAGFARAFHDASIQDQKPQQFDVVLQPAAATTIRVENEEGQPIAGARVREYRIRGVNGETRISNMSLDSLGIVTASSDQEGQLRMPLLPAGEILSKLVIVCENYAPVRLTELKIDDGASAKLTMKPGVNVILRVPPEQQPGHIESAVVDLRYEPFEEPSTTLHYEAKFNSQGVARLSLDQGSYQWLLLQHTDFFLTPVYSAEGAKHKLRFQSGRNQDLSFEVRRKVSARGRVVDAETGKPLEEMSVMGELENRSPPGWDDPPPDKWSFAGWGETDKNGDYTIQLAEGMARVSFQGTELIPERDYYEFSVAADGSTVIPEIKVHRIPKVTGVVRNADGNPAARCVVRLRGKGMATFQPVLTDMAGRFELQPDYIRVDEETNQRVFAQEVVAFDPHSPLAGRAMAQLDKPSEVVIKLEPHEPGWLFSAFDESLTDWQRGIVTPELDARNAAITLRDRPAPELDAVAWLNTSDKPLPLVDLKAKFVLLDFWHISCGPCHYDFPSVKLVHELYKDQGVVVIGVHNNNNTPDEVREHIAKIGLPFPVAVDHSDGRTVARYQKHGIADSFPSYVLISPEGKVLHDDRTIPTPTLRGYKLELIRKYLLEAKAKATAPK